MEKVLINVWPCNFCNQDNQAYLVLGEDGILKLAYEGCGGFQGKAASIDGTVVSVEDAVAKLNRRHEALRNQIENLINNFGEVIELQSILEGVAKDQAYKAKRRGIRKFAKQIHNEW